MRTGHFSRDTLRFPQKDFDMVKEGVVSLVVAGVLIVGVAAIWKSPYHPAVTIRSVAQSEPVLIEKTALGDLSGTGEIASYGPPYNNGWRGQAQSIQSVAGFSPQTWWGTPYPVNTAEADVIQPLSMLAQASRNGKLAAALRMYKAAPYSRQQKWDANYAAALASAKVKNGNVTVRSGSYGPVAAMMADELALARSGLFSGALDRQTNGGIYRWNVQDSLLFLQGTALAQRANSLDMLGSQWGINHDEQAYPGPWWLTPYTFLYQIPPWTTSSAADEMAAYTAGILFMLLLVLPWIPGLNKLPRLLPVHRLIWRDWYRRLERSHSCAGCPLRAQCCQEFKGRVRVDFKRDFVPGCYQPVTAGRSKANAVPSNAGGVSGAAGV